MLVSTYYEFPETLDIVAYENGEPHYSSYIAGGTIDELYENVNQNLKYGLETGRLTQAQVDESWARFIKEYNIPEAGRGF